MANVRKQPRLEKHPAGHIVLKFLNKSVGKSVPSLKRKGKYLPETNPGQGGSNFYEKVKR